MPISNSALLVNAIWKKKPPKKPSALGNMFTLKLPRTNFNELVDTLRNVSMGIERHLFELNIVAR